MITNDKQKLDDDSAADDGAKKTGTGTGGEDDNSTEIEGDDSHLHDDQKSHRLGSS